MSMEIGTWPTTPALVCSGPPGQSETSVEVPPMSKVTTSENPAAAAAQIAPVTPPAGPESTVRTGSCLVSSVVSSPPLDCTIQSGPGASRSSVCR